MAGFTNSSGSSLSFTLALGVFSAMLLLMKADSLKVRTGYMAAAVFITVACIFVGKLGLLFSGCAVLLASLLVSMKSLKGLSHLLVLWLGGAFVAICSLLVLFVFFPEVQGQFAYAMLRSFSIFISGEDSTATALLEMPIPELGINTVIGHGGLSVFGHENATHSDIGYVRSYFSLGLIFSFLLYSTLFLFLLKKLLREKSRSSFVFLLSVMMFLFVSELKEPFIFKVNFVFFLLVLFFVTAKESARFKAHSAAELVCR
ncbi:hypothetical protein [Oleiphilus sp. HI0125]|uniref:hypothetical protein n=1 Tax=Oleiphilus sp. HI0125 TaxID=1822266 RepID=UPI001E569784|nr:hypothetical protein [Oleiphilus sp. HI0125]